MTNSYREERDSLGTITVPEGAYYGSQTERAKINFPISNLRFSDVFIEAIVYIKRAAAIVNAELGLLDKKRASAIVAASDEILEGKWREWFVVDVYQAGAGTSTNMNVNEVIANRAIEILGGKKADYTIVHPNDHVNMSQSTNDVIPTAIRIAAIQAADKLIKSVDDLAYGFFMKSKEFDMVIKSGRTHLVDATPIRLGQEFGAWDVSLRRHKDALRRATLTCLELGIGGTAVGTGLNSHPNYRSRMIHRLSEQFGYGFTPAESYFEAMQSLRPIVEVSNAVSSLAQDLIRIANDLRLMSSGPKTGFFEISLPVVQAGSSIMPGKVNPSMLEMLNMVCFQVLGCHQTIIFAAQAGQLELNVMMPVAAYNLFFEMEILDKAIAVVNSKCVRGITANTERCQEYAEGSMSVITVLSPLVGYQRAAEIVKKYLASDKSIREFLIDEGIVSKEKVDEIFDFRKLTEPGIYK